MKQRLIEIWNRQPAGRRRALPWIAGAVVLFVGIGAFAALRGRTGPALPAAASTALVQRGPLTINIVESGTIRPREQIVLRNELDDPATILFIAPEGKLVKKGDLLVELDVTDLANEVVERRILVQNAEADLIHATENLKVVENQAEADIEQARLDYLFAQQDLKKYKEGEFPKLVKEAEAKITLSEEELSQAQEALKWSEILFKEKYLSQSELQRDELAAKKAQLNLDLARADLDLLNTYTYRRQIDQLESDVKQAEMALERAERMAAANIAQARAQLAASEAELKEESERLRREEVQLSKAKIFAPIDGMVLYASSVSERWRRNEEPIDIGTVIDERDEIIYLPTASEFDVDIKISEVDLNKVDPGLPVRITVDSMPDKVFYGKVASIAQLPDSESRFLNPNLKLYKTVIELGPSSAQLRSGMSCRAEVSVEHFEDTLFVPIQSVVRVNGRPAVYALDGQGRPVPREVEIGLDNSRFVQVRDGLNAGDRILLAPPLGSSREDERFEAPAATAATEAKPETAQPAASLGSDRT